MEKEGQTIKCSVESCNYQENARCTLNEIEVGYSDCDNATENQETLCKSFRCDENKDTEE